MDLSAIALQGVAQAELHLDAAASNLANAGANSPNGADLNTVDLATQIVALNSAQTALEVNLSVLKTADGLQRNVLNIMA